MFGLLASYAWKVSALTMAPSLTLIEHRRPFRPLDVVMAYLPSGLRAMFSGMFPTAAVVTPAGVICLPSTSRSEDGSDEDPCEHPEQSRAAHAVTATKATARIAVVRVERMAFPLVSRQICRTRPSALARISKL